jgi:small-conductance mechanosensitive channel
VAYDSDLDRVGQVTVEVARAVMQTVPGGVPGWEPMVRYHTFGSSSIQGTVVLRSKTFTNQCTIKHEFIKQLHDRYQREGIVIPFPIQTVYTKTGS